MIELVLFDLLKRDLAFRKKKKGEATVVAIKLNQSQSHQLLDASTLNTSSGHTNTLTDKTSAGHLKVHYYRQLYSHAGLFMDQ